ncbi:hypothetical protein [Flavobacterium chilense]|uniref:SprT-like family protein n=1 Tax=Flavobacterium chilense TaxID=946677 RepID=A0A1M7CS32_9FLAO|nr:hypothetical protein [Flavobacterium chilense]SHL70042.1 hypothetical protein SAMN05444484_102277 [Flavobacterium chilense]
MKKSKFINLFLFLITSLLFYNCNNEPLGDNIELSEASKLLSNIKQENTTLDEIKNDSYLNSILQKATKNIKKNRSTSKNLNTESYNLDLSNQVKKYVLNDYSSYTMAIINNSKNSDIFQNLVIEKDILRDAVYLITYYPDENYKEAIKKHLVNINDDIDYTGSKKIEYLYYKRKVNIEEKASDSKTRKTTNEIAPDDNIDEPYTICVETYTPTRCTAGENHLPGQPCKGTGSQRAGWVVTVSCTNIPTPVPPVPIGPPPGGCTGCTEPADNSNNNTKFFPPDSQNPNWIPEYICVAMERGNCTKVIPYTPILTMPMTDPYFYYINVFDRNKVDLLTRFENQDIKTVIDEYLDSHKNYMGVYDIETINLVNNVFDAAIANRPSGSFEGSLTDVWASLRSPVNVDRTSINNDTPEGRKFNSIYNALTQSPSFQKLFVDLFENSDRFNVKFEILDHVYSGNNSVNGEVNGNTELIAGTNDVLIQINKQIILPGMTKSQSKLLIAKTIMHECIHAYLDIKLKNSGAGVSIPNINNKDLSELINSQYNGFNGNQDQHNFIYNHMLPTMRTILADIKAFFVSETDDSNISDNSIYPNYPDVTTRISFDWNDCLNNIVLNGLQNCSFFQNEIGTFFPNGEPETIVDKVKMNNYNQYLKLCDIWLH